MRINIRFIVGVFHNCLIISISCLEYINAISGILP